MNFMIRKLGTIDKVIFVGLVLLTIAGVALTNMSPKDAHKYWLAMNLVFAISAIAAGWPKTVDKSEKIKLILSQLLHWGSTLVAILVVYAFFHSGQIQNETVSLMILLVLALSAFLDGIKTGWYFSAMGILLAIIAVVISYLDEYLWVIVAIAILFMVAAFYFNKWKGD